MKLSLISSFYLIFQWHRMPTTQETDGFQVKRPGDVNVKCTLLLMLDHQVPHNCLFAKVLQSLKFLKFKVLILTTTF